MGDPEQDTPPVSVPVQAIIILLSQFFIVYLIL